jgi:pSer/pThr/pTyr-binding forkhead associated (FHA) protein
MAASLVPKDGGAPILIDKPILLIGRHQDCDIVLMHNPKVSRRHCCVAQSGNRYFIRDLGSMNGVRVNRKRISEVELQPADEVLVADVSFIFERDDVPKAPDHESRKRAEKKRRRPDQTSEESSRDEPVAVDDDASVDDEYASGDSATGRKDRRQGSDSESEADFVRV